MSSQTILLEIGKYETGKVPVELLKRFAEARKIESRIEELKERLENGR